MSVERGLQRTTTLPALRWVLAPNRVRAPANHVAVPRPPRPPSQGRPLVRRSAAPASPSGSVQRGVWFRHPSSKLPNRRRASSTYHVLVIPSEPDAPRWPEDFPIGCPPSDSFRPTSLSAYRFVRSRPPASSDFVRPIDLPRKTQVPADKLCDYYALSIYTDERDIPVAREFIPGFLKKLVARGELTSESGVCKRDPMQFGASPPMESHHNWWIPVSVNPVPLFRVVDA